MIPLAVGVREQETRLLPGKPPTLEPITINNSGPVATGSCVSIVCVAYGASSIHLSPDGGFIGRNYRFAAPDETTTYTVSAKNIHGEAIRRFTVRIDNTPMPVDERSQSRRMLESLCETVQRYSDTIELEILPRLYKRGGAMSSAVTEVQKQLVDLRHVCRPANILPSTSSNPATCAMVIRKIALSILGEISAVEEMLALGSEGELPEDREVQTLTGIVGSLHQVAVATMDQIASEKRPMGEGVPA